MTRLPDRCAVCRGLHARSQENAAIFDAKTTLVRLSEPSPNRTGEMRGRVTPLGKHRFIHFFVVPA